MTDLCKRQSTAVPAVLEASPGNQEYLRAAATGTQNYMCMSPGWTFSGPQATLIVATHFLSPNPEEDGMARPTWQSSFDTTTSTDYAERGAIPWVLLQAIGAKKGAGGGSISETTYIQRMNTTGGASPVTACLVGMRAFVPYTAEYVFYRKTES